MRGEPRGSGLSADVNDSSARARLNPSPCDYQRLARHQQAQRRRGKCTVRTKGTPKGAPTQRRSLENSRHSGRSSGGRGSPSAILPVVDKPRPAHPLPLALREMPDRSRHPLPRERPVCHSCAKRSRESSTGNRGAKRAASARTRMARGNRRPQASSVVRRPSPRRGLSRRRSRVRVPSLPSLKCLRGRTEPQPPKKSTSSRATASGAVSGPRCPAPSISATRASSSRSASLLAAFLNSLRVRSP